VFGGDGPQVKIAADRTMRVEKLPEGHGAGMKARFARFTPPRHDAYYAK